MSVSFDMWTLMDRASASNIAAASAMASRKALIFPTINLGIKDLKHSKLGNAHTAQ